MSRAAEVVADPEAAKLALVLHALGRADGVPLSPAEEALADELDHLPTVAAARAAFRERMRETLRREETARFEAARAAEAQREAEQAQEIADRRAAWKAADPLVRALHVLAKKIRPDKQAERFLALADMLENPQRTLRLPGGVHSWGEKYGPTDRPPPASFRPIAAGLDPEDGS
jgi:hypothetical protein